MAGTKATSTPRSTGKTNAEQSQSKIGYYRAGAQVAGQLFQQYSQHKVAARAGQALKDKYRLGRLNYFNQVNAAGDQIGGLNDQTVGAKNDRLMQYRERLGALRVALGAQGASSSSATAQFREAGGSAGLDLDRLDANNQRQRSATYRGLLGARSGLQIANEQAYERAKAADTGGGLLSTILSTGGAVVGGIYGGPGGAALGAQAGSMAGNAIES